MTGQILLNPTNLTNVTITVRACVVAGDASDALHVYAQNGAAQNYAGDYGVLYKTLDTVKKCADGMQDLTLLVASAGNFDASVVTALNVQVVTATSTGPFGTATVYIDSITATGDAIGPWAFTSNASALGLTGNGVAGATITWLP